MIRSRGGVAISTRNAPRPLAWAFAGLALLLATAPPARAQEEPPRFLLERIAVEGLRRAGSDRLVVAESRLQEGVAYTEDDLRQAVYRIKRLPFILDADFTLRKGSERGRYELVVGIEEVKPYFLQLTADVDLREDRFRGSFSDRVTDTGIVGLRYFVNSHDLAFAAWNPDGLVNLGYTRFNLFGHGGYANLQASFQPSESGFDLSLVAAAPVIGNHAVRSTTSWSESDFSRGWQQGFEWLYNTTDDPLLPTSGMEASARAAYGEGRLDRIVTLAGESRPLRQRADNESLSGRRYWAWTSRQSVSLGANAFLSRNREDRDRPGLPAGTRRRFYGAGVDAGYAWSVWRTQGLGPRRDLRLEVGVAYSDQRADPAFLVDRSRVWGANLGLVFRNAWSLIRLTFRYSKLLGDGR